MDRLLLTYEHINGYSTYAWFETIDDARYFASNSTEVKSIIECCDCSNAKEVILYIYVKINLLMKVGGRYGYQRYKNRLYCSRV